MKVNSVRFRKLLMFTVCVFVSTSCSRADTDRASIKLNPPPTPPDNVIEKPKADSKEALFQSERVLNLIRFARNQALYFYGLGGEKFPPCLLLEGTPPLKRLHWNQCSVGQTGTASGYTVVKRSDDGKISGFYTHLEISPIKTIVGPTFDFDISIKDLLKIDEKDLSFNIIGNIELTAVVNISAAKKDKLWSMGVEQFALFGSPSKEIIQAEFTSAISKRFDWNAKTETEVEIATFSGNSVMSFGTTNLLTGNFDIKLEVPSQTTLLQKIKFDDKVLTAPDSTARAWECKDTWGCLPLPSLALPKPKAGSEIR